MPRFYLNVYDGITAHDHEGIELPNLAAAVEEATQGLRSIIAQEVMSGTLATFEYIEITDESGVSLSKVTFDDALTTDNQRKNSGEAR